MSQTLIRRWLSHKDKKLKLGSKNFLCEGYSCILSKEFESTKELEAVAKFDQNIFSILFQLDALVVGENMLLVKTSFSNLDLLHPVLQARQSWQILFNARTVQLASWGWPLGRLSALWWWGWSWGGGGRDEWFHDDEEAGAVYFSFIIFSFSYLL